MECDFLVIGGGVAGVSAAARLAPLGSVILLEAETALAYHSSGRSAALYEPYYGSPPMVALARASGDFFHRVQGVLSPRKLLLLARAGEEEAFARDHEAMHLSPIGIEEARALVPILNPASLTRAATGDHSADIDTDLLIQTYAHMARNHGACILTGEPVTALQQDGTGWRAKARSGAFHARMVINAAGAWADGIANMAGLKALGLQPHRRSVARVAGPAALDVSQWPVMLGAGESWYAKPDAGALLISPADQEPVPAQDAWAEDITLAEGIARYSACVTEPVTRMIANWAGLRTFVPDHNMVIGPDPAQPDFFWFAGQGGQGFQTSTAASQLAADLIAGRASDLDAEIVMAFSPARFT
ncbi:MAG: NAD(P)/FAD-dependent oxidoreductase [Pseudorhodobacter sp.]